MKLIILSDIFGKTPEFDELVSLISDGYESVKAIDLIPADILTLKMNRRLTTIFRRIQGLMDILIC